MVAEAYFGDIYKYGRQTIGFTEGCFNDKPQVPVKIDGERRIYFRMDCWIGISD
jgi:hypothetical protein